MIIDVFVFDELSVDHGLRVEIAALVLEDQARRRAIEGALLRCRIA